MLPSVVNIPEFPETDLSGTHCFRRIPGSF